MKKKTENNTEKLPDWIIVNFSGGKDSTAMLLRMLELNEHIDEVVCCDVGKEFPAMYRHIDSVRKIVENHNIKFTLLKAEHSFDYMMFEYQNPTAKRLNRNGLGWANSRVRWCTGYLKRDITKRYLVVVRKTHNVIECDGIAADEQLRLERKNQKQSHKRHPLVEWGWTEKDCLNYCYANSFDWEGLYEILDRVSCWCCPLMKLENLRKIRTHFPDLWKELKDMDRRAWNQFRIDYSVDDLDKRFALEDTRIANGLSITNKEFYTELKTILNNGTIQND